MYKILIKPNPSQKYYQPYKVQLGDEFIEFVADTVEELAEEYKKLMNKYPLNQIKVVQELEPEILVNIVD